MSRLPIDVRSLAHDAVLADVHAWLASEADRVAAPEISANFVPLVPALALAKNTVIRPPAFQDARAPSTDAAQPVFRLWFREHEEFSFAGFSRSLQALASPVVITCAGNCERIETTVACDHAEAQTLAAILKASLPTCQIRPCGSLVIPPGEPWAFRSLLPPVPYWGWIDGSVEGFRAAFVTLAHIPADGFGVCQCAVQRLPDAWRAAVRLLAQAEQQVAERIVHHRNWVASKIAAASAEKKLSQQLFAATFRAFVVGHYSDRFIDGLMVDVRRHTFSGGDAPLATERDVRRKGVARERVAQSLREGRSLHHGMLLSTDELALFLPLPSSVIVADPSMPLQRIGTTPNADHDRTGIFLGTTRQFDADEPVVWPQRQRTLHLAVTGVAGSGKTVFMALLAAEIARNQSEGLAIIDPHDTLIEHFVEHLDESRLEDCVLHDPTDSEHVLALPLFDCENANAVDTATGNITLQLCALFDRRDMGHHIVRGLHNVVKTVLSSKQLTFLDARTLLDCTSKGSALRERVCASLDDPLLVEYWMQEFEALDRAGIGRIASRIDKVLEPRLLRPLLANRFRKISYRQIIDDGLLFLGRTAPADAGPEIASILGTLHLTGLHTAALTRQRREPVFTIFADEFGNYANPHTMAHALRTIRKFGISEVLGTQNIEALPDDIRSALDNIGTHVALRQGWQDAQFYFRLFNGAIPAQELLASKVGSGFAKLASGVTPIRRDLPRAKRTRDALRAILENTRQRYCIPRREFDTRLADEHGVSLKDLKHKDRL